MFDFKLADLEEAAALKRRFLKISLLRWVSGISALIAAGLILTVVIPTSGLFSAPGLLSAVGMWILFAPLYWMDNSGMPEKLNLMAVSYWALTRKRIGPNLTRKKLAWLLTREWDTAAHPHLRALPALTG